MISRSARMLLHTLAVSLVLLSYQGAEAAPILGQQIYYEGGNVSVTVLPYEAGYTSNLYLFLGGVPVYLANSSEVGKVVNLGDLSTIYGVAPGAELIFGITVVNTGDTFLMGPASRNPDNVVHATIDYSEGSSSDLAVFGFEDLFGGGDLDYNDVNFRVEGGVGLGRVPEPSSLVLMVLGMITVALVSRSLLGVPSRKDETNFLLP